MKRKNIIGLSVFSKKTGEIIGVVQELKMDRENANIASFIVTRETKETKDNSLILPFSRTVLNDDDLEATIEDMMTIDSIMYYNESRKSEQFFNPKSIYDSEGNSIGIISDFDFNKRTGVLENIFYFNTNTKRLDYIEKKWVKNFYDYELRLKTVEELKREEEIELERIKSEEKVREALNYFKNMELEAKMHTQTNLSSFDNDTETTSNKQDYTTRLDDIINSFKSDLKFEQEKLRNTYLNLEKELIDEYEKAILQFQSKKTQVFDNDIIKSEQNYLNTIEDLYNNALTEINNLNSSIFATQEPKQVQNNSFDTPKVEINNNHFEQNMSQVSSFDNSYNNNLNSVETRKFIDDVFNEEAPSFNNNINNSPNKLEEEQKPNDNMFDNNKELEKLYELQRKRMNILKKL